jgi:cysteine-rich repeat protein
MAGTGCEPVPGTDCSLRPDAGLTVIFLTDTGEQTPGRGAPPGQPDNSVASWVHYFADYDLLTPGAQRADVHGILCPLRPTEHNPEPCSDRLEDGALFDRYSDVIHALGGAEGSIRDDDQSQLEETIREIVDATIAGACCGDGVVAPGEECDDGNQENGDCCSSACRIEPATTVCRPAAGTCDLPETCTGSSATCPPDGVKPAIAPCRPAAGPCDEPEACTGTSPVCPVDSFKAQSVVCRPATGVCDVADTCSGSSAACPADAFEPATSVCRPAANQCDAVETCTGTGTDCPVDFPLPDATPCEDGNGCTTGDTCWGFGCIAGPSVTCTALDACHLPGVCDPASGTCSNPQAPDGTPCSDGNACTENDSCWGEHCMAGEPLTCNDGDGCTEDSCDPVAGCTTRPLGGLPGLSCLCARGIMDTASCSGERIPDGVSWRFKGACMLIARAETAPPRKARKLITKASRKLRRAAKVAASTRHGLTAACSTALGATLGEVRTQVQELF